MFKAFRYRAGQALSGKPLGGPLSAEVLEEREEIARRSSSGLVTNPYKLAAFVVDKFRMMSRIVEPQERVDPYVSFDNPNPLQLALRQLRKPQDPARLAAAIRQLLTDGVKWTTPLAAVQLEVLYAALPLAQRVNEAFTLELLTMVPDVLLANISHAWVRQVELLKQSLFLAAQHRQVELVSKLVDVATQFIQSQPTESRSRLIGRFAGACSAALRDIGLTAEARQFLSRLHADVAHGATLAELKVKRAAKPERWATILQALLALAGGWEMLEVGDVSSPLLEAIREELLGSDAVLLLPKDYVELARAYIAALSRETDTGLDGLVELYRGMNPAKVSNTWTTAEYYSQFHLQLVEDTVFAVCRLGLDSPIPAIVQA